MAVTGGQEAAIRYYENRNIMLTIMNLMNVWRALITTSKHAGTVKVAPGTSRAERFRNRGRTMVRTFMLSVCLAASLFSLDARAQDEQRYTAGPVTEVDYIQVEYGHFETYVDWLNSTWKPTMEALKKAGLIVDYKVFMADPKSPDQPNIFLMITFKNMAAYAGDIGDKKAEFEAVTRKVICSTACQNKLRVARNDYRKVLGSELIRELILK